MTVLTCEDDRIRPSRPRRRLQPSRGMADLRKQIDMTKRTCDVPECERPHLARGLCGMHYQRAAKTGSTDLPPARLCTAEGCEKTHYGRGYCGMHLKRLRTTGTLEVAPRIRKTCTFGECGRPAVSRGLCNSHANQVKRGKPLTPLRPVQKSTIRDDIGRKRCSTCKEWREVEEFYPNSRNADDLSTYCKRCDRSHRLKRNYGITADQYDTMLVAQGGGCAICGGAPKDGPSLHIDHDHSCCPTYKKSCGECVRGLLCEDCNRVLGMFVDSIPRFESAIDYLRNGGARRE